MSTPTSEAILKTETIEQHEEKQDRILWRVPLFLSLPSKGQIGQVGSIDLNARTGEILADAQTLKDIGGFIAFEERFG